MAKKRKSQADSWISVFKSLLSSSAGNSSSQRNPRSQFGTHSKPLVIPCVSFSNEDKKIARRTSRCPSLKVRLAAPTSPSNKEGNSLHLLWVEGAVDSRNFEVFPRVHPSLRLRPIRPTQSLVSFSFSLAHEKNQNERPDGLLNLTSPEVRLVRAATRPRQRQLNPETDDSYQPMNSGGRSRLPLGRYRSSGSASTRPYVLSGRRSSCWSCRIALLSIVASSCPWYHSFESQKGGNSGGCSRL